MAATASRDAVLPTRLAAGQRRRLALLPGSHLHVEHGRLRVIESPQWLAERMVMPQALLPAGAHFVVSHRGWVELQADTACTLVWREPAATAPSAVWGPLWRWLRGALRAPWAGARLSSR